MAKGSYATNGVLLEACSFSEKGGWILDTQFYHQMGGNYLLAHGMGEVVADASTMLEIPDYTSMALFAKMQKFSII